MRIIVDRWPSSREKALERDLAPQTWRSTALRRDRSRHLLQDSVDSLPGARTDRDILDLPTPDEPAAQGFIDGLGLDLDGKLTLDHHVDERS